MFADHCCVLDSASEIYISEMAQHWQDSEVRELLLIRGEEKIRRQVTGTVRDTTIYKNITNMLSERGIVRTPRQVINKLKALKRKYLDITDKRKRSGMGRVHWPFYDLCENIYGESALANPVKISSSSAASCAPSTSSSAFSSPATDGDFVDESERVKAQTEPKQEADDTDISSQAGLAPVEEAPETSRRQPSGFCVPLRKRKRTGMDQLSAIISTAMAELKEMDRVAAEREDARMQLFMEHERKLLESQERLLREDRENQKMLFEMLLSRLPGIAPQTQHTPQLPVHQYGQGDSENSFYQGGPAYSSTQTKHEDEEKIIDSCNAAYGGSNVQY